MNNTPATAGRAFEIIRAAIESSGAPTRTRGEHSLMTSCPLHQDTTPSLSVTWKPRTLNTAGVVLLHCFSCGAHAATIAAAFGLRMSDLFDESAQTHPRHVKPTPAPHPPAPPRRATEPAHRWQRVRVYTYTTDAGAPVQQVIREECRNHGAAHKRFLQRYRDGRRWVWRKPEGFTPVLYRAPALAAADRGRWVWLTEGEKDADTAAGLGRLSTTNAQGAQSFPPALTAELAGRNIALLIDRDPAGYRRGLTLHDQLRERARACVLLLPATTAPKSDLTDHVEAGLWQPSDVFGGLIVASRDELESLHRAAAHTSPPH
jgi:DNA primase